MAARERMLLAAVAALGLALSVMFAMRLYSARGVYFAQVQLYVSAPAEAGAPNLYATSTNSAIAIAGIAAVRVDPSTANHFASPGATLVGAGVRQGWWVRLPDSGGQWASLFADPLLDIQAVDPRPGVAQQIVQDKVNAVQREIGRLQDDAKVLPINRFTTRVSPPGPVVVEYRVGRSKVSAVVALAVGLASTLALVTWLRRELFDRSQPRRRRRVGGAHRVSAAGGAT